MVIGFDGSGNIVCAVPGQVGIITGGDGVINAGNISSDTPSLFSNSIDFGADGYSDSDFDNLDSGTQSIISAGNQGGSTLLSEGFSFEILSRTQGALLLKTGMVILYDDATGKRTDYLVSIDGLKVGVLVSRAVGFPVAGNFSFDDGLILLERKLNDVLDSTANVSAEDLWEKQTLHIFAYSQAIAGNLQSAYATLSDDLKSDTIVLVTVTNGEDAFLY